MITLDGAPDELTDLEGLSYCEWALTHPDEPYVYATIKRRPSLRERFATHVNAGADDQCWEWTGNRDPDGYGRIGFSGRTQLVHRVAYLLEYGVMPPVVRHRCDNPPRCNPRHLLAGTQADNMRDVKERRRHAAHGQTHCQRGHEFTPENTYLDRGRYRRCRACRRAAVAARKESA